MNLAELQRAFLALITQPLTASDGMSGTTRDGRPVEPLAQALIKPSARLTSFERLELYNTGYWFRILEAVASDFPGVRAAVGERAFRRLSAAYLDDHPPPFDLRDLGAALVSWLRAHPEHAGARHALAVDMARLEWAEIEVSDTALWPSLSADDFAALGTDPSFELQPCLRLLDLAYPVDDLLLAIREGSQRDLSHLASNAVAETRPQRSGKCHAMPGPHAVHLAVHRQGELVYFKRLPREGFLVLAALIEGLPLSEALARTLAASPMRAVELSNEVAHWFADWASLGWFCTPARPA